MLVPTSGQTIANNKAACNTQAALQMHILTSKSADSGLVPKHDAGMQAPEEPDRATHEQYQQQGGKKASLGNR